MCCVLQSHQAYLLSILVPSGGNPGNEAIIEALKYVDIVSTHVLLQTESNDSVNVHST